MVSHSFNNGTQVAEAAEFLWIHNKPHLQRVLQTIKHHSEALTETKPKKKKEKKENKQLNTNAGVRVAKVDH